MTLIYRCRSSRSIVIDDRTPNLYIEDLSAEILTKAGRGVLESGVLDSNGGRLLGIAPPLRCRLVMGGVGW